jgi:hypothetical protein
MGLRVFNGPPAWHCEKFFAPCPLVSDAKGVGAHPARLQIKGGDCDHSLEIYYGGDSLEIGGVHAGIEEWRSVLLAMLQKDTPPS